MFGNELPELLISVGYVGIFLIIFAESGFFAGFFLPGDSLLFTAGILAAAGVFNIWILLVGCAICAIAGDSFGYAFGRNIGPKIFSKEDSFFFRKKYIEDTSKFYELHGKKTLILARFVPVVRTFAPIFAGVGKMSYKVFLTYNVVGGILWTQFFLLLAYILGTQIPGINEYVEYIIIAIIILSFLPFVWNYARKGTIF